MVILLTSHTTVAIRIKKTPIPIPKVIPDNANPAKVIQEAWICQLKQLASQLPFKLWRSITEGQNLQDTVPNQEIGNRQIVYYLPFVSVVVVEVDS